MNKRTLFTCVLISGVMLSACSKKQGTTQASPTPVARRTDKNLNQEPLANRPYVRLFPRQDGHAVTVEIEQMKKQAQDVEYEIEYSAGSLLQGAFGKIDSLTKLPVSKEILLGSCSTGGKCTYNTDVTGGTLSLRFGTPDYSLQQEWSYTDKAKTLTSFSSRDGKFSFAIPSAKTTKSTLSVVTIYNSPGYPDEPGEVIAGPYVVSTIGSVTGSVSLKMHLPLGSTSGKIRAWDGKKWSDVKSTQTENDLSATTTLAESYVIVK